MVKDRVGTFSGTPVPQYRRGGCPPVLLLFFLSVLPSLVAGLVGLGLMVMAESDVFAQAAEEDTVAELFDMDSTADTGYFRQPVLRIVYAANTRGALYPCPS